MVIHPILAGLIPSVAVAVLFWFVMRAVLRADRNEREALAKADAEVTTSAPVVDSRENEVGRPGAH